MTQERLKQIINILIGVVVITAIVIGIFLVTRNNADEELTPPAFVGNGVNDTEEATPGLGQGGSISEEAANLIFLIGKLRSIDLDHDVVLRPDFKALTDITTPIVPEPVGVTQPFEELP